MAVHFICLTIGYLWFRFQWQWIVGSGGVLACHKPAHLAAMATAPSDKDPATLHSWAAGKRRVVRCVFVRMRPLTHPVPGVLGFRFYGKNPAEVTHQWIC